MLSTLLKSAPVVASLAISMVPLEPANAQFLPRDISKSFSDASRRVRQGSQSQRLQHDTDVGVSGGLTPAPPKPSTSGHTSNIDWFQIGTDIGKALSRPSGNQQWQPNTSYYDPRPVYRQQPFYSEPRIYSVPPASTPRTVSKPAAALIKNELPVLETEAQANTFEPFKLADDAQLQQTAQDLSKQSLDHAVELAKDQRKNTVDQVESALKVRKKKIPPLTEEQEQGFVDAFAEALEGGDVEKLREAGKDIHLSQSEIDRIVDEVEMTQSLDNLADAIHNGASAEEVAGLTGGLKEHLKSKPGSASIDLQKQLDKLNTMVEARDVLFDAVGNQEQNSYPPGMAEIYNTPGLPEGTVAMTPDGQWIQGTGGYGELSVQQGTAADVLGIAVPEKEPIPDVEEGSGEVITSGVVLTNSKTARADIHYRVDGHDFTMAPGFRQELSGGRKHVIDFDRGGDYGPAKYTLEDGTFGFEVTSQGWDLYRQSFDITIDNSQNKHDFAYLFNGEPAVAQAGTKKEHKSDYPVAVTFDRGDGGEPGNKSLKSGKYRVGLDAKKRRIDLFLSEDAS